MTSLQVLGLAAAALTSLSFIPQVVKTIRTGDTSSISLFMYSLFTVGVFCWLIWGYIERQLPVFLANGLTFALASVILVMKINAVVRHKEKP
jgi:MtN3 and saliva related transmembrane protein